MARVHRCQVRAENPFALQELSRRAAFFISAFLKLGRLFREMNVQRGIALAGPRRNRAHRGGVHCANAVDGRAASHPVLILPPADPRRPTSGAPGSEEPPEGCYRASATPPPPATRRPQ